MLFLDLIRFRAAVIAGATIATLIPSLIAHEGGHHVHSTDTSDSRVWNLTVKDLHIRGSFVAASSDRVQIRRDDGRLASVKTSQLAESDQTWIAGRVKEIEHLNMHSGIRLVSLNEPVRYAVQANAASNSGLQIAEHFKPFAQSLQLRQDSKFFYVGSNSIPQHPMMIGIRAWQQQVPLPQSYVGENAWRIPLHPVPAKNPRSTKNDFLRGAIALAVNGVPIFNPLNNRGDDALLAGELDDWGGHCGRGDDYHYHIAPVHLESITGAGQPIAYALDGYPIYGYQDEQAADFAPLDKLGGHKDKSGLYHYHATETYPYVNGGFYGEVTKRGGQVDPQPRDSPIRPAGQPLRGATITDFSREGNRFQLEYDVSGRPGTITYVVKSGGNVDFTYQAPSGTTRTESYRRRKGETFLPLSKNTSGDSTDATRLTVTSSAFAAGSEIPIDFTGDGLGESPPIAWTEGPPGTECYAVNVWHVPGPGGVKSYWLLYDIPPDVTSLPKAASGIGTAGYNDKDHTTYDPMRSKGAGTKEYHITVYALSKKLEPSSPKVTRDVLLQSIAKTTLAEGTLSYQVTRTGVGSWVITAGLGLAVGACVALLYTRWLRLRKRTANAGLPSA